MSLLSVLTALAAEQAFSNWRDETVSRAYTPLHRFFRFHSAVIAITVVIVAAVLVGYAIAVVHDALLTALLSALVLFLCLGPRDISSDINALLAARANGETAAAERILRALHSGPEPEADHRSLLGALFIQSHERVFGVLFWFIVCGPGGAVVYRLSSRLPRLLDADSPALRGVETLHAVLAWLPARATALLYAFAGSMDDALAAWYRLRVEPHPDWRQHTWSVLAETSTAAIGIDNADGPAVPVSLDICFREILRMQNRALLIVLAANALLAAGATFA
jgi:AmpE protein